MAYKGIYGQAQGNEHRTGQEVFHDHCLDNTICEGAWRDKMIKAAKQGNLKEIATIRDEMKEAGYAQERCDSNLRQAMNHLKI